MSSRDQVGVMYHRRAVLCDSWPYHESTGGKMTRIMWKIERYQINGFHTPTICDSNMNVLSLFLNFNYFRLITTIIKFFLYEYLVVNMLKVNWGFWKALSSYWSYFLHDHFLKVFIRLSLRYYFEYGIIFMFL